MNFTRQPIICLAFLFLFLAPLIRSAEAMRAWLRPDFTVPHLWYSQNEIGSAGGSNRLVQLRIPGAGLGREVGASVAIDVRTNAAAPWSVYVPLHDHRGNVVLLLNRAAGTVAEYNRYTAFGEIQTFGGPTGNPWLFSSKRFDSETGLSYFGRRYYDPLTGRFISADPLGFIDGPNRYLYTQANPLTGIDPDGLLARQLGQNFVGWAEANFSLVNGDWRFMPMMNYLDYDEMPFAAMLQNSLLAPTWNLAASTLNPMIDVHIYGSDSEYAAAFFVGVHPEVQLAFDSVLVAAAPVVQATVNRIGQSVVAPTRTVANPIPSTMARVIPEGIPATTLGRSGSTDVMVTAADDIAGMNAAQIAERLKISQSPSGFRVIEFSTPQSGVASPVFRSDPGFVGGGLTGGGAREFVIPNQPIPPDAIIRGIQ